MTALLVTEVKQRGPSIAGGHACACFRQVLCCMLALYAPALLGPHVSPFVPQKGVSQSLVTVPLSLPAARTTS